MRHGPALCFASGTSEESQGVWAGSRAALQLGSVVTVPSTRPAKHQDQGPAGPGEAHPCGGEG